jgi:hypothetical protein
MRSGAKQREVRPLDELLKCRGGRKVQADRAPVEPGLVDGGHVEAEPADSLPGLMRLLPLKGRQDVGRFLFLRRRGRRAKMPDSQVRHLAGIDLSSQSAARGSLDAFGSYLEESARLVRSQILQRAAWAVQAQANQQPRIALALLADAGRPTTAG